MPVIAGSDPVAAADALVAAGRPGEALALLRAALGVLRDDPALLFAAGCTALRAGIPDEAVSLLRAAAGRLPGAPPVLAALARALAAAGRPDLGAIEARRGLRAHPGSAPLREALAVALDARDDHDGAAALWAGLAAERPDDPGALAALAEAHAHAGRTAEAMGWFDRALAAAPGDPQIRLNRATVRLAAGDDGGWADWEGRLDPALGRAVVRDHALPRWDGSPLDGGPLDGGLLVEAEQGIGEQVLFAALMPAVAARVRGIVLECHPRLVPIFGRSFPDVAVRPFALRGEGPPPTFGYGWLAGAPPVARHVEIGSLPVLLGTGLATPPATGPFLVPDPERTEALRARYRALGAGPVVGLTWRSRNARHGVAKSLAPEDLVPLARARPDAVFVSLQYGAHRGDLEAFARAGMHVHVDPDVDPLVDLDAHLAQTAAVDLAVGASNTALHLAAAVGRPVWALVAGGRGQLWYWGDTGETARWYAGVRVFRRTRPGTWAEPAGRAAEALKGIRPA